MAIERTSETETAMNGNTRTSVQSSGHFGTLTLRFLVVLALAFTIGGALAHSAGATDNNPAMDKNSFKTGCESGGGSYVENPDGSFQCNLKDGGVIKCPSTTSQCTYTPALVVRGGGIRATGAVNVSTGMQSSTPTPSGNIRATGAMRGSQIVVMSSGPAPTATPAP